MIAQGHKGFRKNIALAIALTTVCAFALIQVARAETPHSDKLVPVSKDVTLRVIEAGPAEAQVLVLVPGWCFTADIWSKQIAALGDRYHVVAFDPRSQGRSTILDHSNSPDDRASDIAGLIKTLRLRKPVLVGWSQGVQDVAAYALKFGTDDVAGLVFVDAPVSAGAAGLDAKAAAGALGRMPMYVGSPHDYLEVMMTYLFKQPLSPAELTAIVDGALKTPSSVGVANMTLDLFGKDYRKAFTRMGIARPSWSWRAPPPTRANRFSRRSPTQRARSSKALDMPCFTTSLPSSMNYSCDSSKSG